ncbi:MAG: histidine kinase, partial [Fibrobacterota bacterium]
ARFFIGKISYVFLFLFGFGLLKILHPKIRPLYFSVLAFYGCLIAGLFIYGLSRHFDDGWFHRIDLSMRYFVAFPGALLAGISIWLHKDTEEIRALNYEGVPFLFKSAAVLFWGYAIFAGLIVKRAPVFPANIINSHEFLIFTGLPVQFFRAGCAIGLTFFVVRILKLFELEKSQRLENAYQEIIRISTHEQERIGRDIHDGLCQELSGIQLTVKALEQKLRVNCPEEAEGMKRVGDLVKKVMTASRGMARNLYPVEIEDKGLTHALNEFCGRISERYGISCGFRAPEGFVEKDHMTATHLFRITQEAVYNSVRHGKADQIEVTLSPKPQGGIELTITDNGSGLADSNGSVEGMGIKIMKYRARVLKGVLNIRKLPTGETVVEFER